MQSIDLIDEFIFEIETLQNIDFAAFITLCVWDQDFRFERVS